MSFKKTMENADRVIKRQKELQKQREEMEKRHKKIREERKKRWDSY